MYYFFDESGDWNKLNSPRLVLSGLLVPEEKSLAHLKAQMDEIKSDHEIDYLHAMESDELVLEHCYEVIRKALEGRHAKAYVRLFDGKSLSRTSHKTVDEVYMDLASDLVSTMIMGDANPDIAYDVQFYYSYPKNVIRNIKNKKPKHFDRVMRAHVLKPESCQEETERIMQKFTGMNEHLKESLAWFEQDMQAQPHETVSDYLWTELWLKVKGDDAARELFRHSILQKLDAHQSRYSLSVPRDLRITYYSKDDSNVGIELIDILCNLVHKKGQQAPTGSSNAVKTIYNKISLEVVK